MKRFRLMGIAASTLLVAAVAASYVYGVTWHTLTAQGSFAPVSASATGAAAQVVATLPATAGKLTYIEGFTVTGGGSTTGLAVNVTVGGTTNTLNYTYAFIAGVTLPNTTLDIRFPTPMPASALNTAITVTVPTGGSGNLQSSVTAYGFQQ